MIPEWVKDAVFYQIFPDRFFNGDISNDPENVRRWDFSPTIRGFQGGDLLGIIKKFDYLLDLGINAIYLNPIFRSSSTHRYDTIDYFQIDPKLGNLDVFRQLIDVAHTNGVRIVLDGVFNHTARGFFAFNDILENSEESPFCNWYHINHFPIDAYSTGKAKDYDAWWGHKSLPKLNTLHLPVRNYLFSTAKYWIKQGIDGWRLDVPNEIDDDSFWDQFQKEIKEIKPDAYLVGEIWEPSIKWVDDHHFDGIMNYPVREYILDFLRAKDSAEIFNYKLINLMNFYSFDQIIGMFNILGSHDTERILTLLNKDSRLVKLAYLFLFTIPGVPVIYYGDEVGLQGGKDPDCRRTFPWDSGSQDLAIYTWIKKLMNLRKTYKTLRIGKIVNIPNSNKTDIISYARVDEHHQFAILINRAPEIITAELDISNLAFSTENILTNLLDDKKYYFDKNSGFLSLSIAPKTGLILM